MVRPDPARNVQQSLIFPLLRQWLRQPIPFWLKKDNEIQPFSALATRNQDSICSRVQSQSTYITFICSSSSYGLIFCRDNKSGERDVFNERPTREEQSVAATIGQRTGPSPLANSATIHTTLGDIHMRLFPQQAPKAVENFVGHARSGYFEGVIFHRVIPKFMIQTGDPLGDGTGGVSIWGKEFEDEFSDDLKHDRYVLPFQCTLILMLSRTALTLWAWPMPDLGRMDHNFSLPRMPLLGWTKSIQYSAVYYLAWKLCTL